MFDRTGRPVGDRAGRPAEQSSQNTQIRTLLDKQKEQILAKCQAGINRHEFQAAYDRRSLRILKKFNEEINSFFKDSYCTKIWNYVKLIRKVSVKWKSSTFDTVARRRLVEDQDTILELSGRIQELQNEINCMSDSNEFQDAESIRSGNSHVTSRPVSIPPHPVPEGMLSLSFGSAEPQRRAAKHLGHTWYTVLELYDLEIHQKKLGPDYHRLKTMVKRSIEQDIRNKIFGARNGNYERNAVVINQGTKQRVQRILGDCWQWEANGGSVPEGDNCRFRHDIHKRGKMTQSNTSPNSFMQQNERKASRTRSPRGKSPIGKMYRWPCKEYLKGTCNNSFCEK